MNLNDERAILLARLKNELPFYNSKIFNSWFHDQYPGTEQHHLLGSFIGRKTTNLLSIPAPPNHAETLHGKQHPLEVFITGLPTAIKVNILFIKHLEETKR